MSAQRLNPTTRTDPGDLLAGRGLPTILWNNDGDDLAWPAYPEHHADGLWCAGTPGSRQDDPIPLPRIHSLADYLAARIGPLAKTKTQGLYFFNFVRRDEMPLLDEFGDRARLAQLPKEYFLEPGSANDLEPSSGPLPLALAPGTTATASLFVADDPAQAREVTLELRFLGALELPRVTLNRHPLAGLTPRRGASGLTLTLASAELRQALKRGVNEFSFTSPAGSTTAELEFAREWTVFGPCAETDPAPAPADLAACPGTLLLGDREFVARPVKVTGRGVNLGQLLGDHRERQGAWAYIPVTAPRSGHYGIGLGADWWFEAFLDGQPLIDTLETGNLTNPPNRNNHLAEVELMAGVHTLAVRVLSGSAGWTLDAGAYRDGAKLTALSVRVAP